MRGRTWLAQGLALLISFATLVAPAAAQTLPVDLSGTFASLQNAGQTLTAGVQATTPSQARAQGQAALATLLTVRSQLEAVLASNPTDDVVRSRSQAVLDQVNEGIKDIQTALSGPDSAVMGSLRAAQAQILEAVAELQPIVPTTQTTAAQPVLPSAGENPVALPLVAAIGAAMLALGSLSKMRGNRGLRA